MFYIGDSDWEILNEFILIQVTCLHNTDINWRGVGNMALSDSRSNMKFSLWFTSIHRANWKENVAIHQKSLGTLFQASLQLYYFCLFCGSNTVQQNKPKWAFFSVCNITNPYHFSQCEQRKGYSYNSGNVHTNFWKTLQEIKHLLYIVLNSPSWQT